MNVDACIYCFEILILPYSDFTFDNVFISSFVVPFFLFSKMVTFSLSFAFVFLCFLKTLVLGLHFSSFILKRSLVGICLEVKTR